MGRTPFNGKLRLLAHPRLVLRWLLLLIRRHSRRAGPLAVANHLKNLFWSLRSSVRLILVLIISLRLRLNYAGLDRLPLRRWLIGIIVFVVSV